MSQLLRPYHSQLFKADQRGSDSGTTATCLTTFNSENTYAELKTGFGGLKFLNDIFLKSEEVLTFTCDNQMVEAIIPIAGSLIYRDHTGNEELIKSEQVKYIFSEGHSTYTLYNPYQTETVNYLHIGFEKGNSLPTDFPKLHSLQLNQKNVLVSLNSGDTPGLTSARIGIFEGRYKETFLLKNTDNGVFAYIINGAFEVENRLMEYRDGLSLWNTKQVEFEALSEHAIILFLEVPLTKQ